MKNRLFQFLMILLIRFGTVLAIVGCLLPPDAENPHLAHEMYIFALAAFVWTMGDVMLADLAGKKQ